MWVRDVKADYGLLRGGEEGRGNEKEGGDGEEQDPREE